MKTLKIIIVFIFIVNIYSCRKKTEYGYQSKGMYSYELQESDSLTFHNSDSLFIGRVGEIMILGDNIVITDRNEMKVWIFDQNMNYKKIVGRRGKGPGEFTAYPQIIRGGDQLCMFNVITKKIYLYDSSFTYSEEVLLPSKYDYTPHVPLRIEKKYIFNVGYRYPVTKKEYYTKYTSLVALDDNVQPVKEFLEWGEEYEEFTAYAALNNVNVLLAPGDNQSFFALQKASYRIYKIGLNFTIENTFGIKPLYFKDPPDYNPDNLHKYMESTIDFISKTTDMARLDYDSSNKLLYLYYVNRDAKFYYKKDSYLGKHYLQVYNNEMNCIFDGEIPGIFVCCGNGKVYVLTDENPELLRIKSFQLIQKK